LNAQVRSEPFIEAFVGAFTMKIKVYVPYGIYEGASNTGKLTVLANSV